MKIAILFKDNDFHSTFKGVLGMLFDAYRYTENLTLDKRKLCFLINKLVQIAYVTHQNHWEYRGLEDVVGMETHLNEHYIHIEEYLSIKQEQILLNDEVDAYLKNENEVHFFNGETFILDTELFNNNIYTV